MKNSIEAELVQAAIEGGRKEYAALVERYAADIFATCLGMVSGIEDAKDLSQETFLRGFTRIGQLRSNDKFRPWIIGIARNVCRDHLRRKRKRDAGRCIQESRRFELPDEYREVHEALARLPEKYRVPLLMYYFDGRSSDSVADALNISRDGVLTRLSRGRRELRRMMESRERTDERSM